MLAKCLSFYKKFEILCSLSWPHLEASFLRTLSTPAAARSRSCCGGPAHQMCPLSKDSQSILGATPLGDFAKNHWSGLTAGLCPPNHACILGMLTFNVVDSLLDEQLTKQTGKNS